MGAIFSIQEGEIIATDVSAEAYMEQYAADFCEWVDGVVIKMSPARAKHIQMTGYLYTWLSAYFELKPIGIVLQAPFVLQSAKNLPRREPDLQIILNSNPGTLTETYMEGPADICIEVVSPESVERDHGTKLREYEAGGVGEYWIFDPVHREHRFFRLNDEGKYTRQELDTDGYYETPALPGLKLHVPTLLQDELPGPAAIVAAVRDMLEEK